MRVFPERKRARGLGVCKLFSRLAIGDFGNPAFAEGADGDAEFDARSRFDSVVGRSEDQRFPGRLEPLEGTGSCVPVVENFGREREVGLFGESFGFHGDLILEPWNIPVINRKSAQCCNRLVERPCW